MKKIIPRLNAFTILLILFVGICLMPKVALCQPPNNNCADALEIILPNNNYGLGTFSSAIVEADDATSIAGTYFLETNDHVKDVWFWFYLPTARYGKLELFQVDQVNESGDLGFITYLRQGTNCPPPASWIEPAKLTPVPQQGSSDTECLDPGMYLIQVTFSEEASGMIYLDLTLADPFYLTPSLTPLYDFPDEALQAGTSLEIIDMGCHTIDSDLEFDCFPISIPESFNQSIWGQFQTGQYIDYVAIMLHTTELSNNPDLPAELGIRLLKGDVTQNDWSTLPVVGDCALFDAVSSAIRYKEFSCDLLEPNTYYSFAIYFPEAYVNTNVGLKICPKGAASTGAPAPILSQMEPSNVLGTLNTGVVFIQDTFTCASSLTLFQNQCGSANPADFVTVVDGANTLQLEYATWVQFNLVADTKITFLFEEENDYRYVRIFNNMITEDCNAIDAVNDLYAVFKDEVILNCMPPGDYAMQILGTYLPPDTSFCSDSHLGKPFKLKMTIASESDINNFDLSDVLAYEPINNLSPLIIGELYNTIGDIFGCRNTVQIEDSGCPDRKKIMVREFVIDQEGVVLMNTMGMGGIKDFHYKLFSGSIVALAQAQNAFLDTDFITGAVDYVGGCIEQLGGFSGNYYCVTPGQYTLVTIGGDEQRNLVNSPSLRFYDWSTNYNDPNNPEFLGDVTNVGVIESEVDVFSCGNNPLTIDGVHPCFFADEVVQQIYRVFYLSESRIVRIKSSNTFTFNLFQGDISNGASDLVIWEGENSFNNPWVYCAANQQTSDCDLLTPGYYTLVAYGEVASYDAPSLHGTKGAKGGMGLEQFFTLTVTPPDTDRCNLPDKTCFANEGELADWDQTVLNSNCPITGKIYLLDTMYFNCVPDTPFSNHPIAPCDTADNRTAYYGFKLSVPSFVILRGIPPQYGVKMFDFDATLTPELMGTEEPIYDCLNPQFQDRVFCNVPPGTYTIVVFAEEEHAGYILNPILIIDRVVSSRFDHWANAYDFGLLPGDGVFINGRPGDIHPTNSALPPSTDFISCQTSSSPTDPTDGICCTTYNELVNTDPFNIQYLDNTPADQLTTLRNIVYTFQLEGSGTCSLKVKNCISAQLPQFAIYKSDSGTTSFEDLQLNGGIDSTIIDGLTLITHATENSDPCDFTCKPARDTMVTFEKTACAENIVRYYILVSTVPGLILNQQLALEISYDGAPFNDVQFDEFDTAGSPINSIGTSVIDTITAGFHCGEAVSFQCATIDPTDPLVEDCIPEHSVWYRFFASQSGYLHMGFANQNTPSLIETSDYLKLYKVTIPGDFNSLLEVPLTYILDVDPDNPTGDFWNRGCISYGEYYLFWTACDELEIFDLYTPCVYFEQHAGDFCSNALPIDLAGEGTASATITVDCHTIGTDVLDGPDSYECLPGPEGYKSSFFVLNLTGPEKRDVTFSLLENTSATPVEIRYRVLSGYCGALTPGLCSPDPNTSFTLNCLGPGSYIIQVVTIDDAIGTVTFTIDAVNSPDQDCIAPDPLAPKALFNYDPCQPDIIYFENLSTFGSDVAYEWVFPDWSTSEKSPSYAIPSSDEVQYLDVSLKVTNIVYGLFDEITVTVEVPPYVEPIESDIYFLCPDDSVRVTAKSYSPGALFSWSTGAATSSILVTEPGDIKLEVLGIPCPLADSTEVVRIHCDSLFVEVCDSFIYNTDIYYEPIIFTDTITGGLQIDTLREVFAQVNGIDDLLILPADLEIKLGDEIELNAVTNATLPIFNWFSETAFEQVNAQKIRAIPVRDAIFTLLVEDIDGCIKEVEARIKVDAVYDGVYFPNAFSPNGDGINDYFYPFGASYVSRVIDFQIFSRWGEVIFKNSNTLLDWQHGWDGRFLGKDAQMGVYPYWAKIEYIDGTVILYEGDVTVLR